ncbi:MAG: prefoldin subunit alpha [Candidatus Caldarchaeum sp.]|uniref:Prefoldin subunit alpha n=1 Tax=Caldiarchaeum subterraneum TaxID=311458 RepID=A0A7C5QDN2_CALS0
MSEAEIAQALEQLQVLERIVADLQARLLTVQRSIVEHEEAVKLIEEIKKTGGKMRIMVPLGAGAFAEASFDSLEKVTISLGAGVYAVKALDDTQQLLTRRSQNLQALSDSLSKRIGEYSTRVEELRSFLGRALSAQRQQGT